MLNLDKNKYYLLACSFGPDSMALFDMLEKEGFHFAAALVNYHLRPESTDEMKGFVSYCEQHKISYHVKDVVNGIPRNNLESECRKIRYEFFASLVAHFKYDAVLVAHNQDDHIETYLMQKSRQNLVTFYGISEKTTINGVEIIRPLLSFKKSDLQQYCIDNNVPFAIDSSNADKRFTRNKIRHEVVQKMSDEERKKILKEIDENNKELASMIDGISQLDLNSVPALLKLSITELAYAINSLAKKVSSSISVSLKQIKEIKKVLSENEGNVDIPIKRGFVLRKSYLNVEFLKPKKIEYSFLIEKPCIFDCEYFYLNFLGDTRNRNVYKEDYPLTIRNYSSGDKYTIKNYVVSVRRLFIDWKMPLSLRQRWPIILNKNGKIIYIPRYKRDFIIDDKVNFYVK